MNKQKSISLPEEWIEFIQENNINLSGFVQDKLQEEYDLPEPE
jgi:hypothetical protein